MDEQDKAERIIDQRSGTGDSLAITSTSKADLWLSILQRMSEGAISHLDLQELLRELLSRIREVMEVDSAAILLVNEDRTYLSAYVACGPVEDVTGQVQVPMGRGVAGIIAASRQPMIVGDLAQVEVENPLLRATARSLVGTPVFLGYRVIGVIHVDSVSPHHFSEEDSQLLQMIASPVALAIERVQLYEAERAAHQEVESIARQLLALQVVSDVALEHMRLNDLLQALLQRMQRMLDVENVAILLPTPDGQELTLYTVRGPEEAVMGQVHVPMGQGVAGTIAATREPLIVENLAAVPVVNPFLRKQFRSLLGVPLLAGGRLVGVIHVDTVQPRNFSDEDKRLLQMLAEHIAAAISRSQQYESMQQSRTEAERRVAALEEATERMDEFLSVAGHELRTPLTILSMNIQMLDSWLNVRRGKRTGESATEYATRAITAMQPLVQRSKHSIHRLDRLVGDLLEASRMREHQVAFQLQCIDLVSLVHETVDEQRQAHDTRMVQLEVHAHEPLVVEADPDRITQVLNNYLSNALKFSRPEQPVTVTLQVEADQVRVSVHDEGVGIPETEQDHIWERFYQAAEAKHQSGSQVGLGLGLYISREIIERHGGHVGVQSTPGNGSVFWFTLPLAR